MALLVLQALAKSFRSGAEEVRVLAGVDLEIEEGTSVVITGESGCGKTTLLNLVAGLDSPTAGRVLVDGTEISRLDERALAAFRGRTMGFVFQFHYLLRDFTALENVLMPAWIQGRRQEEAGREARRLLEEVGLGGKLGQYPAELSGGERQRVLMARALAQEAPILLLDEATSAMDVHRKLQVFRVLDRLNRDEGLTVLTVLHDVNLAALFCRRMIFLKEGGVVADGLTEDVLTAEVLEKVYQTRVWVQDVPLAGKRQVVFLP